jgi:hypothetical protein
MSNEMIERGDLEVALLGLFPPVLRASVLEEKAFRDRAGVTLDATVRLDQAGISFKRSALFGLVRDILADKQASRVLDGPEGQRWTFDFDAQRKRIRASDGSRHFFIPDFRCLSASKDERLRWFDTEVEIYAVDDHLVRGWRAVLASREVEDEEVDPLLSEFRLTPSFLSRSLPSQLRRQSISVTSLIPGDLRYYDRLVGALPMDTTLRDFVDTVVNSRNKMLLQRDPIEGLKTALLSSSHPWIPRGLSLDGLPHEKVVEGFQWLEKHGDRFSQVGAVECGFAHLMLLPQLEPILGRIVQQLLADRSDDEDGRLKLLCSLVVLVDGELARTGICRQRPPFWRRVASIAHAAALERAILAVGLTPSDFNEWAMQNRGHLYYLQSFVDMRKEPRWNPDFILPKQLSAEFVGRIAAAGAENLGTIKTQEVRQLFNSEDPSSAQSRVKFPWSYLPGPLEGAVEPLIAMPSDIETDLRAALEASELTPKSFVSLVNSSLIFRIDAPLAMLAAEGLRRVKYQLRQIKSQIEAFSLLNGLATVAAVTRSGDLADEVRILLRVVRRNPGIELSQDNAMRIALVAAAAHADISKWSQFLGECFAEFAFEDMSIVQAGALRQNLLVLCQLEPQLWQTMARADAATSAFIQSSAA